MNHSISLQQAQEMVKLYRSEKDKVLNPDYKDVLSICETFDRSIFDSILAQPGCAKMRFYFGMSVDLKVHLIVVGVNDKDEDILPQTDAASGDDTGIGEEAQLCPPACPPPSGLYP